MAGATIKPASKHEAMAWVCLSDIHVEEPVDPRKVGGRNRYNVEIAKDAIQQVFENGLRLAQIQESGVTIPRLGLFLGGDGFSGTIHDDLAEGNQLSTVDAVLTLLAAYERGIRTWLQNSPAAITVVCTYGNHGRLTDKMRVLTARETSLEWLLYRVLAHRFEAEPRVTWAISEGYHQRLDVYGVRLRFHHGDSIKYAGGMGGITIPVNKAIASWNIAEPADLDVFGHFHQFFDGGRFICNGSVIGYAPYSVRIKAPYEPPQQAFFLIDSKWRRKTIVAPILLKREV